MDTCLNLVSQKITNMNTFSRNTLILAAVFAILSVNLGAFGAHGLKPHLSEHQIEVYKTGVAYQFYHAF